MNLESVKEILKKHLTIVLITVVILVPLTGFFVYQKIIVNSQVQQDVPEVDITFDPEGPYAVLIPRRDGKALNLNMKRTSSYDQIRYEISYNSEGVDRGASGEINTKEKKGEYDQEILFGSCSTGGTCVYDKGVENGTLTLHIRKGNQAFRMVTQWHLQQPDVALGKLVSGDNHFSYIMDPKQNDLAVINYTIINELTGAPKLPADKVVVGQVYALTPPLAKTVPKGEIGIELADNPPSGSQLARFVESDNKWLFFETKIDGSKLKASVDGAGIFAALSPKI